MAVLKTQVNRGSVTQFLNSIQDDEKRKASKKVMALMKGITGYKPMMWGDSMVGFGSYHYRYESGREGDWFLTGFSPRKQNLTLYIMNGFARYKELMKKLGKYKTGKACLYIKNLEDIDLKVLETLIQESITYLKEKYHKA